MLKTIIKWVVSALGVLAAIATIGSYFAPDLGKTLLDFLMYLVAVQMTVPGWLVLLLCLALVTAIGIFLRNWWISRTPIQRFVRVKDLSLNELLVIEVMHQQDGESVSLTSLAQLLNLKKLEVDVALQALENHELVTSILVPVVVSSHGSTPTDFASYFFSARGKEFAVATLTERRTVIASRNLGQSKKKSA